MPTDATPSDGSSARRSREVRGAPENAFSVLWPRGYRTYAVSASDRGSRLYRACIGVAGTSLARSGVVDVPFPHGAYSGR